LIHANPMRRRRVRKNEVLMGGPSNDNNLSAEVNIGKGAKGIVIGLICRLGNLRPQAERIGSFLN
jgi:hypothetical protein